MIMLCNYLLNGSNCAKVIVSLLCVSCLYYLCIPTKGSPINQQFYPFYYVIAGDTFSVNCTASNPQSRGETRFSWYRNSEEITNLTKIIASDVIRRVIISTSQLYIEKVDSDKHSGRYICIANGEAISTTTVIVES